MDKKGQCEGYAGTSSTKNFTGFYQRMMTLLTLWVISCIYVYEKKHLKVSHLFHSELSWSEYESSLYTIASI